MFYILKFLNLMQHRTRCKFSFFSFYCCYYLLHRKIRFVISLIYYLFSILNVLKKKKQNFKIIEMSLLKLAKLNLIAQLSTKMSFQ